jgi:hypothetical protein
MSTYSEIFSTIAIATEPAHEAPNGIDGEAGTTDLSSSITFVSEGMKVVLAADNNFSLKRSIAWNLYVGQDKPTKVVAVTDAHATAARVWIAANYYRYSMLQLIHALGVSCSIRASDAISDASYSSLPADIRANLEKAADRIYCATKSDPRASAAVAGQGSLATLAWIANAMHRARMDGHNWLTSAAAKKGTAANAALGIAPLVREEFASFMEKVGHDLWHFVPDATMEAWTNALCGMHKLTLTNAVDFGADTFGPGEVDVGVYLKVPDAAKDRWPVGLIGISSIILGMDAMGYAISCMATRLTVESSAGLQTAIKAMRDAIQTPNMDRSAMITIRQSLEPSIAFAAGLVNGINPAGELFSGHPALNAVGVRNPTYYGSGENVGKFLKGLEQNDELIASALTGQLQTLGTSIMVSLNTVGTRLPDLDPSMIKVSILAAKKEEGKGAKDEKASVAAAE